LDLSFTEKAALEYCAPHGIPLSVFHDGRVVYPGNREWLPRDVQAAMWWLAKSGCGHDPDKTVGAHNEDTWNASIVGYCDACRAMHRAAMVKAGRDELDPLVGARYRLWRDKESNGHIQDRKSDGRQTEPAGP
jgi:hypothetical protein